MSFHCADIPDFTHYFPQFDYPIKVVYDRISKPFYGGPEILIVDEQVSYEELIKELWDIVCQEFEIHTNICGWFEHRSDVINDFIHDIYGKEIEILGKSYDTAKFFYTMDNEKYNNIAYDWVENVVQEFLEHIVEELDSREINQSYTEHFYWMNFTFTKIEELDAYGN